MQATTTLRIAAILTSIFYATWVSAQVNPSIRLDTPQITTRPDGSVTYEIALRSPLPEGSTAALASMQIHSTQGLPYPLWLSDATIEIKKRTNQRQTLRIQAQRPNVAGENEIMLAFTVNGNTRFVPYALLAQEDAGSSEGRPLPSPPIETELLTNPVDAIANGIIRNIEASPLPPKQAAVTTEPSAFSTRAATKVKQTATFKKVPQTRKPLAEPEPALAVPAPVTAALAPTNPTATAPVVETPLVVAPSPSITPPANHPQLPTLASKPLQDTFWWIMGTVIALLWLYLLIRFWLNKRSKQRNPAPIPTRETQFQHSDRNSAANTVFGLSDSEAVAMQQQWMQQQFSKKQK